MRFSPLVCKCKRLVIQLQLQDKALPEINEQILGLKRGGVNGFGSDLDHGLWGIKMRADAVGARGGLYVNPPMGRAGVPAAAACDGRWGPQGRGTSSVGNFSGSWAPAAPLFSFHTKPANSQAWFKLRRCRSQLWGGRALEKCPAHPSPKERCGANCLLGTGGGLPRQPPAGDVVRYANKDWPPRTSLPLHVYIRAPRISRRTLRLRSLITEGIAPARCGAPRREPVAAAPHRRLRCRDGGDGQLPVLPLRALL